MANSCSIATIVRKSCKAGKTIPASSDKSTVRLDGRRGSLLVARAAEGRRTEGAMGWTPLSEPVLKNNPPLIRRNGKNLHTHVNGTIAVTEERWEGTNLARCLKHRGVQNFSPVTSPMRVTGVCEFSAIHRKARYRKAENFEDISAVEYFQRRPPESMCRETTKPEEGKLCYGPCSYRH